MNAMNMNGNRNMTNSENEILCNCNYSVTEDGVIIVDRSMEEDTSDLLKNIFRTRSKH